MYDSLLILALWFLTGFIWVPLYRKVEGVGEVYAYTEDKGVNWCWVAVKHVLWTEEDKEERRTIDGDFGLYKADVENSVKFHKDAFAGALHFLGLL